MQPIIPLGMALAMMPVSPYRRPSGKDQEVIRMALSFAGYHSFRLKQLTGIPFSRICEITREWRMKGFSSEWMPFFPLAGVRSIEPVDRSESHGLNLRILPPNSQEC